MNNLTWHCEICKKEREDSKISVLTYQLEGLEGAERNLKYCNDNQDCYLKALNKAKTGKI